MPLLYRLYEFQHAALLPWRMLGDVTRGVLTNPFVPASYTQVGRSIVAGLDVLDHATRRREKPAWGIDSVEVEGTARRIRITPVAETPFCRLLHFERVGVPAGRHPKVLLVAPLSGHHATLLRGTVAALAADHEVYVTDWRDARLIADEEGEFGLEDYLDHVLAFMRQLAPRLHVMAVCQPAPLVLAAVSLLAEANDPAQPLSMTLMGGPVDTRAAPTQVTRFAEARSLGWFERAVIAEVPASHPGAGRLVYPGFLQLGGFISMNASRHFDAHLSMFRHLVRGDGDSAAAHRAFYDEYLAVMDVPAAYYLETVDQVFQRHLLPRGIMTWRGRRVRPELIKRTALLTVEGELDDISAPGQTLAAHDLCAGLPATSRANHLQHGVGHYGIFNGRRWREEIKPRIAAFIRRAEAN